MKDEENTRFRFGIRFSLLARRWRQMLDAHLANAGLTDATWIPLVHLEETGGGMTQKALAALVGIEGPSLVRLLDIVCSQGLVERRPDESDGRARLVYLTPAGKRRVAKIRRELALAEERMLKDVSEKDIAMMLKNFERIDQRITQMKEARGQITKGGAH
jgi:MarR family transcriptional regulator for hemolysin